MSQRTSTLRLYSKIIPCKFLQIEAKFFYFFKILDTLNVQSLTLFRIKRYSGFFFGGEGMASYWENKHTNKHKEYTYTSTFNKPP